jgi:hypothetical protein
LTYSLVKQDLNPTLDDFIQFDSTLLEIRVFPTLLSHVGMHYYILYGKITKKQI